MYKEEKFRFNKLGRLYIKGKPLSESAREKIIELSLSGARTKQISKFLQISNSCVFKICQNYYKTGEYKPQLKNENKSSLVSNIVLEAIIKFKRENPTMLARQIRSKLLSQNLCSIESIPCVSLINSILRKHNITTLSLCSRPVSY